MGTVIPFPSCKPVENPDLQFCNCGSFVTCMPVTDTGLQWLVENIADEEQALDGQVCIEHRYLEDIVLGARAEGLVCHG